VAQVGRTLREQLRFGRIDIETEHVQARVGRGERKRQADVAKTDDAYRRLLVAETRGHGAWLISRFGLNLNHTFI